MIAPHDNLPDLPPNVDLETSRVLKALIQAHKALAELKGHAPIIPNQAILLNTFKLQEAKESSAIENIITTEDDLFRAAAKGDNLPRSAKEIAYYGEALELGYKELCEKGGISNNMLIAMFQTLLKREDGYRTGAATALRNERTGELIYQPPQDANVIKEKMHALEHFVNSDTDNLDPLVKVALIHYQFESIHPFPDGNGRVGRILCVLYLVSNKLLDTPILFLSRYINRNKPEYYRLLQEVRSSGYSQEAWEEWVIYMLEAVSKTAVTAMTLVGSIREQMADTKRRMRDINIYSQILINNLFRQPYTRIEFVEQDMGVTRPTATRYLNRLVEHNILRKRKVGRNMYYMNDRLVNLLVGP